MKSRRWFWFGFVAVCTMLVVFTPLRAPILELALTRERSEFSTWDESLTVGKDGVRAIRVRPYLLTFIDRQYLVEVTCDRAAFDALVKRRHMTRETEDDGFILRVMAWKMATWWPAILRRNEIFCSPDFPTRGRGGDGAHFAGFYDETSSKMFLWVKDNF